MYLLNWLLRRKKSKRVRRVLFRRNLQKWDFSSHSRAFFWPSTNNNNNIAVNLYTVKPVQGKGLGLIASRGLKGLYSCKLLQWLKYNPYFRRHIVTAGVMLRVRVSPHDDEGEGGEVWPGHHEGHQGLAGDPARAGQRAGFPHMPWRLCHIRFVILYDAANPQSPSNHIPGGLSLMFLYRVYKCDIYKTISTTMSALSLQLSKTTLAQQFDSLNPDVKDQFLQLTNVFTSDSSSFSDKLIGKSRLMTWPDYLTYIFQEFCAPTVSSLRIRSAMCPVWVTWAAECSSPPRG